MRVPSELTEFVKKEDDFFIASHFNPEGDALGSSIALHMALKSLGKRSVVFNRDLVPDTYRFLPGSDMVTGVVPAKIDNLLLLDCNSSGRAGLEKCIIGVSAVIDHHLTSDGFGDIRWVVPECPATGLMVFNLLKVMGADISEEMAINLYTAIGIDTGIFRYSNTSYECLAASAELVRMGADPGMIAERLFNNYSRNRFLLLKETLNSIDLRDGIAVTVITAGMYISTGTTSADTENFVNYPLLMGDVQVAMLFRQLGNDSWKVSLRSKGTVDVSIVATAFGGGGHRNAAGCEINAGLQEAKERLLKKLKDIVGL